MSELAVLQAKLDDVTAELRAVSTTSQALQRRVNTLTGAPAAVNALDVDALQAVEVDLEAALRRVRAAKEKKLAEALGEEKDKRLCIVCQDRPKCVLVMPCRHLCMCSQCALRLMDQRKVTCPICRGAVAECMNVYD